LHSSITVSTKHWWRHLLVLFTFNLARREKFQRRVEVFVKRSHMDTDRGYATFRRGRRKQARSRSLRIALALLLSQEQCFLLIYCYRHSPFDAFALLAGHILMCFIVRNRLANDTSFHVLCPLGLESELVLAIAVTQFTIAWWG
jgi:hypothetical protein